MKKSGKKELFRKKFDKKGVKSLAKRGEKFDKNNSTTEHY